MTYHTCTSCPPHTTLDHGDNGKGTCLILGCPCQKMVDGEEFVKPSREKVSHEDAIKRGAERAEAESFTNIEETKGE